MRHLFLGTAILALAACGEPPMPGAGSGPADAVLSASVTAPLAASLSRATPSSIPSRYIVVFHDRVADPRSRAERLMLGAGGEIHFTYANALRGFAATIPDAALQRILADPDVKYVEPDQEVHLQFSGGDGETVQQSPTWGLDRIDQSVGLDERYTFNALAAGVRAYVIDTGIRSTHADFVGRVAPGVTVFRDRYGTEDCNGHGTHVAGTIGGTTWGVAKSVTLVPVRVLDCRGSGTWSGVISGMDWVAGQKGANASVPMVANMSLGGGASQAVDDAVERLVGAGVTLVVAAGNSNANACSYSPARAPAAITVAAIDGADARASWSNFGTCVDIFAPGVSITSAWYRNDQSTNTISGTSMAAPHVAGVAALMLDERPGASPSALAGKMTSEATAGAVIGGNGSANLLVFSLARFEPLVREEPQQGGSVDGDETATPGDSLTDSGGNGGTDGTDGTDGASLAIDSLSGTSALARNNWKATATLVVAFDGAPQQGVAVSGAFSIGGSGSCTTDANGRCSITSGALQNGVASTRFSVQSLVAGDLQDGGGGLRCVRIDKDGGNGTCD
jgi:aqualysin 1